MHCAIKLRAKEFLPFLSCFCQMISYNNVRQLHTFSDLFQKPPFLGKLPVSSDDLLLVSSCLFHHLDVLYSSIFLH